MTRDEFVAALRAALMQLDDFSSLRSSPLLPLLCTPPYSPTPVGLQNRLLDAVEELRYAPGPNTQRLYEVLHFRYVEHLPQTDVAFQLGISERQLRREQMNAIELLAERIWQATAAVQQPPAAPGQVALTARADDRSVIGSEMDWLRQQLAPGECYVGQALAKTLADVAALTVSYGVRIGLHNERDDRDDHDLGLAAVPPVALRQAVLTVLTALVPRLAQQEIQLSAARGGVETRIRFAFDGRGRAIDDTCAGSIQAANQILNPFGGRVELRQGLPAHVEISVPTVNSVPVLVVDDNPDATALMQRFAQGSRFHVVCTNDAHEALFLACEHGAKAILIDIMMPQVDGWDLLAELRHHPATQHIPVAVCSVLPQHELSRVLGARMFIQKPLTQDVFLRTLDALTACDAEMRS